MRIVRKPDEFAALLETARREAQSAFGDGTVYVEPYVESGRHVEIQILGDHHGGLVHLGERECSIQRRHQKIIEESPSPIVDDAMRAAMGEAALSLAGALGYQSAGTVELLVDEATREFFFLEVNTRLQVEHPVTEAVTGIDLVREQLRIADGEPLGYGQAEVTMRGHAIEARLYAEDPARGFLPSTGTLHAFSPAATPEVRWDAGVEAGSVVGLDFDPMLAKVIAHAPTRTEAAGRLALALERLHVGGVTTNAAFLAATLRSSAFLAGDTTTDFIERVDAGRDAGIDDAELVRVAMAAALWLQGANRAGAPVLGAVPSGWRNARLSAQQTALTWGERRVDVRYQSRRDGAYDVEVQTDGEPNEDGVRTARVHRWTPAEIDLAVDGMRRTIAVTRVGERLHVQTWRGTVDLDLVPRFPLPDSAGPVGGLVAPMPGVAADVRVAVGDHVSAKQVLVVLEAMKMEHHITAPVDGTVTEVLVKAGGQVANGELLLVLEPDA
jgi:propionyl-CoA carboxylase alpha chain